MVDILIISLYDLLLSGVVIYIVLCLVGVKFGGVFQVVFGVVLIVVVWWNLVGWLGVVVIFGMYMIGVLMILGGVVQMLVLKFKMFEMRQIDNGRQNMYFLLLDNMVVNGNMLLVLYGEMQVGLCVIFQEVSIVDEGDGGQVVVIGC